MDRFICTCDTHPELFFDSTSCTVCGRLTGFNDDLQQVCAFDLTEQQGVFYCPSNRSLYRQCGNYAQHNCCNGMVAVAQEGATTPAFCYACHFNKTIPDLSVPEHLPLWKKMEHAKRRTLYTLKQLRLYIPDKTEDPSLGLSFEFLTDRVAADHFQSSLPNAEPVFTGHDQGNIVINLAEADEVARASNKVGLAENYRTLLGHFRHEIGHYFWDRLIAPNNQQLQAFRDVFGDEQQDYQAAMDRHYSNGPIANWAESYISAYATMHPWEDWAETWAHYLHIIDTLDTAQAWGFEAKYAKPELHASSQATSIERLDLPQDGPTSITHIIDTWMHFSVALNALNRSMGQPDAYPFVLSPPVKNKLTFVHNAIYQTS